MITNYGTETFGGESMGKLSAPSPAATLRFLAVILGQFDFSGSLKDEVLKNEKF